MSRYKDTYVSFLNLNIGVYHVNPIFPLRPHRRRFRWLNGSLCHPPSYWLGREKNSGHLGAWIYVIGCIVNHYDVILPEQHHIRCCWYLLPDQFCIHDSKVRRDQRG
nr:MAG TPA: hypothetical protein [Caudoviricetes sp.]